MIFYIFVKWQVCASICPVLAPEIKIILMSFWVFRILLQQIKGAFFPELILGNIASPPSPRKLFQDPLNLFWSQFYLGAVHMILS